MIMVEKAKEKEKEKAKAKERGKAKEKVGTTTPVKMVPHGMIKTRETTTTEIPLQTTAKITIHGEVPNTEIIGDMETTTEIGIHGMAETTKMEIITVEKEKDKKVVEKAKVVNNMTEMKIPKMHERKQKMRKLFPHGQVTHGKKWKGHQVPWVVPRQGVPRGGGGGYPPVGTCIEVARRVLGKPPG